MWLYQRQSTLSIPTKRIIVLVPPFECKRLLRVLVLLILFNSPFTSYALSIPNGIPIISSRSILSNYTRTTIVNGSSSKMNDTDVMVLQTTSLEGPNELLPEQSSQLVLPRMHHRVYVMVEPSPFTYISGYANRFQQLLQYIQTCNYNGTYQVEVITTEVVAVSSPLPTVFDSATSTTTTTATIPIPIHYCSGIRLPFYPTMSIVSPYFWKNNLGGILRRIHIQQPQQCSNCMDLIHVSSPGFMIFYAIFYSRYYSIPLLISYHTHLPIYIQSYIPNKVISPIMQWIGRLLYLCCEFLSFECTT